jgi:hypothetical protein
MAPVAASELCIKKVLLFILSLSISNVIAFVQ